MNIFSHTIVSQHSEQDYTGKINNIYEKESILINKYFYNFKKHKYKL
jgi:hypothetical protein